MAAPPARLTVKARRGGGIKKKVGTPRVSAPTARRRPFSSGPPATSPAPTGPQAPPPLLPR